MIGGERVLYQEGALALMRTPDDLIARYTAAAAACEPGTVMMSGTLNAIGGIRPAARFEMRLEDPATGRAISARLRRGGAAGYCLAATLQAAASRARRWPGR